MKKNNSLRINATNSVYGQVNIPGSKSITNRIFLMAAFCSYQTKVYNYLDSEDTLIMLEALSKLGLEIKKKKNTVLIKGDKNFPVNKSCILNLGNAGTVFRPLTAVLAFSSGKYKLYGTKRMYERPIKDLVDVLINCGCEIKYLNNYGYPPIEIGPSKKNINSLIKLKGDISSQFLSSLLMSLPRNIISDTEIKLTSTVISKPYINLTIDLLKKFGIEINQNKKNLFSIKKNQNYQTPKKFYVESDASSASYFFAMGAIADGQITVNGFDEKSNQGDMNFLKIVKKLGADVKKNNETIIVKRKRKILKSFDLDMNKMPDVAMTLAVLALFTDGTCKISNIASWRVKETDRLQAMRKEIAKTGAVVIEGKDYIKITPPKKIKEDIVFDTYDDHRMAMSLSLVSFLGVDITINEPNCVKKTYPNFFLDFKSVTSFPIITIDGPSGSGKGTISKLIAKKLRLNYLDSGFLYRLIAYNLIRKKISNTSSSINKFLEKLEINFKNNKVYVNNRIFKVDLNVEEVANMASNIAKNNVVRKSLNIFQKNLVKYPGLVADGRDMGTVVFPNANLKIFLTADLNTRALRRYKQLIEKGNNANLSLLVSELDIRDKRDYSRIHSPLKKADDAILLDSTKLTIEKVVSKILHLYEKKIKTSFI